MNIGFFGHSNCAYRGKESFLDIFAEHMKARIINVGVKQGSEERILFELKKSKNLNLAIIFHCPAKYIFIPNSDRDISTNSFSIERAENLLKNDKVLCDFAKKYNPKFVDLFGNDQNLFAAIKSFRDYFYHPDLVKNRFYGALIQIDQYLHKQNISAIHIIDENESDIPSWFKFQSGILNQSIMKIVKDNAAKNYDLNGLTKKGNILVATELINILAVRGREVLRLRETQETEVRIPRPLQP